jgi:hypothetical protein
MARGKVWKSAKLTGKSAAAVASVWRGGWAGSIFLGCVMRVLEARGITEN